MSHKEQVDFCLKIKNKFPEYFLNKKVLDVGSLDINGANRFLFENCDYTGIDIDIGKNVDVVCKCHEYNANNETFDTIVSTECFEHDMYFPLSLKNIIRMLKPKGLFFCTAGGIGRREHGTVRTCTVDSPFTTQIETWNHYYKNIDESWFREIVNVDEIFEQYEFTWVPSDGGGDFQFFGIKK